MKYAHLKVTDVLLGKTTFVCHIEFQLYPLSILLSILMKTSHITSKPTFPSVVEHLSRPPGSCYSCHLSPVRVTAPFILARAHPLVDAPALRVRY